MSEWRRFNKKWQLITTAGSTYTHHQNSPVSSVTITHGLRRYPNVRLTDTSGNQFGAPVQDLDVNRVLVEFNSPKAFRAHFS